MRRNRIIYFGLNLKQVKPQPIELSAEILSTALLASDPKTHCAMVLTLSFLSSSFYVSTWMYQNNSPPPPLPPTPSLSLLFLSPPFSVSLCLCLSILVSLSLSPFVCLSVSVCLCFCLSVYLPVCLCVCRTVCLPVSPILPLPLSCASRVSIRGVKA